MLTINNTNDNSVVELCITLRRAANSPVPNIPVKDWPPIWANDFNPGLIPDNLPFWGNLSFEIPIGKFPLHPLIRMHTDRPDGLVTVGGRHVNAVRHYERWYDYQRYGTVAESIIGLDRRRLSLRRERWSAETDVDDATADGCLHYPLTASESIYTPLQTLYWMGVPLRIYYKDPWHLGWSTEYVTRSVAASLFADGFTVSPLNELLLLGWSGQYRRTHIRDLCSDFGYAPLTSFGPDVNSMGYLLHAEAAYYRQSGYARNWHGWRSPDFSVTQNGYKSTATFTYTVINAAWSTRSVYGVGIPRSVSEHDVTWTIDCEIKPKAPVYAEASGTFHLDFDYTVDVKATSVCTMADQNVPVPSDSGWEYAYNGLEGSFTYSAPHISTVAQGVHTRDYEWLNKSPLFCATKGDPVGAFHKLIDECHPHMRAAAALSANDALSNYSSPSNWLESLPELPGMITHIPDMAQLGRLIRLIARGDPTAIPLFIEMLASGYLLYKYGAKPGLSDIAEAKRIANEYWGRIEALSASLPTELYGTFSYEMPDKLDGVAGQLQCLVRTKMVLGSQPGSLLAAIIASDKVGILPSLARIWDLVPFSFVVDWFTSLSDRFEAIDKMAIRAAMCVDYYVHTYTYVYTLNPESYRPLGRSSTEKPSLRVFKRERSLYHPLCGNSKYDFHPPRGLSNHFLATGALLWVSL